MFGFRHLLNNSGDKVNNPSDVESEWDVSIGPDNKGDAVVTLTKPKAITPDEYAKAQDELRAKMVRKAVKQINKMLETELVENSELIVLKWSPYFEIRSLLLQKPTF